MQFKEKVPLRFLRIRIVGTVVLAKILRETLVCYQIEAWVPPHQSTHDGYMISGERKTWHVYKEDRRIIEVDPRERVKLSGGVIDITTSNRRH